MSDSPRVSVIIPVRNGAHFLKTAIASILAQNYDSLEILVVDDGSADDTVRVAERLPGNIRCLSFPHQGLAATRLEGIAAARGEILAFLDVDDIWAEDKLFRQLHLLDDHADLLIVNGYTQLQRLVETDGETMRFENWGEPVLAPSFGSALFRRQALEQLGMTRTHKQNFDLDWFMRARELELPMQIHSDVVQYYRRHGNNMSNDQTGGKQSLLFMLKESLARRSAQGKDGVSLPPL